MGLAIALSVPVFFVLMGAEFAWNLLREGDSRYTLQDSLNNLACGIGQQMVGIGAKTLTVAAYALLFDHVALWQLPSTGWVFALALVGADLCYYWFHRAGHRVNVFWAGHAVHHQSEEMNLSVALRQSWFVQIIAWVFYMPLAVLGVPPALFGTAILVITLYQFWIHTEVIRKLWAPLEWLFNTPSHHRAHHGTNPRYLDANYAGMFMLWDRMFGTFVPEEQEVVYGTVAPLRSWNPLWANLYYVAGILRLARECTRWRHKLWAVFAPPEWRPDELGGKVSAPEVSRDEQEKYLVPATLATNVYVSAQFFPALTLATLLLVAHPQLGPEITALLILWALASVQSVGGLLERRPWARPWEAARLAGTAGLGLILGGVWVGVSAGFALLSLVALVAGGVGKSATPAPVERATPQAAA
jgi:alkylglycerol monooxygenase